MNQFPLDLPAQRPVQFMPFALPPAGQSQAGWMAHWDAIRKHRWLILVVAAVVAVAAGLYALSLPPVYRSVAVVIIEPTKPRLLSIEDVYSGSSTERGNYLTQVEILKSHEVALRTVQTLRLWETADFDPRRAATGWVAKLGELFGSNAARSSWSEAELADSAAEALSSALAIEPVRLSSLVRVSVDARDRELAAKAANTLVRTYIDMEREARQGMTQNATGWLQQQIESMRLKLTEAEQALQAYRDQHGLINLGGSSETVVGQQVNDLTQRLAQARARRMELESSVRADGSTTDPASIPAVARDPAVLGARLAEQTAAAKVADLSDRYGTRHFSVIEAESQLRQARLALQQQVQIAANGLRRDLEAARSTERTLTDALATARGSVQNVNRQEFRLSELERDVQANKQLYEMLLTRAKETAVGSETQGAIARLVDPAGAARIPVKPQKTQIVALAAVAGLLLGTLVALMLERLDTSLKGADDVEARLSQPVLASLPSARAADDEHTQLLFLEKPQSHFAEAIRTARTSVLMSYVDLPHKVVLVTSSGLAEGKTTLATNLAMAHAQARRTLLIDADMRRPRVAARLGLPASAKGLANLVTGTANPRECMHFVKRANLWVMPVGDLPPNPLELLLSKRFRDCLAALTQQFEVVLIDSPPVGVVSDALVLAPLVSGVIFVVKSRHTPHSQARDGVVKLQRAGGNLLGVVLNQADPPKSSRRDDGARGGGDASGYGDGGYAYPAASMPPSVMAADPADRSVVG